MKKALTREQLLRRLVIIKEDVEELYEALDTSDIKTSQELRKGCSIDTHLTNILVVTDVDENGIPSEENGEAHRVETDWTTRKERVAKFIN
tara:strand:- start:1294 stop:1566 length:273 start_codon:yes stop_codon:yes gene_type:complete